MGYKLKFEDFLDKMQGLLDNAKKQGHVIVRVEDLENAFPELAESEDERTRKELIDAIRGLWDNDALPMPLSAKRKDEWIAWLEKQKEPLDKGEISDGYHTFNELYYYRMLYNAAFFNLLPKEWVHKSKKHHTGEECFGGGWFIVMAELPTGQISNHYEMKDWDLFDIPEKDVADEWDGHTPQEASERLHNYLLEKQGEQKPFDYENATIVQKDFAPKEYIPRYNIGDVLCDKSCTTLNKEAQSNFEITDIRNGMYICDKCSFPISQQDEYVLVAKRIEQKPAWSEEDECYMSECIGAIATKDGWSFEEKRKTKHWLKSLKDRVQPKQEWSEEDSYYRNHIIQIIEEINNAPLKRREDWDAYINWLKSLRPQK